MDNKPVIYVIDDEPAVREAILLTASLQGFKAVGFASACQFLDEYDPAQTGCIVSDFYMPGMTGLELLATLRGRGDAIPAIIISGAARLPEAVNVMKLGAVDFLQKPYAVSDLRAAMSQAAELSRSQKKKVCSAEGNSTLLHSLSAGEREVARLTVAGETDKRIASQLDVSMRTVQLRRRSAIQKLRVTNKAELIRVLSAMEWQSEPANGSAS